MNYEDFINDDYIEDIIKEKDCDKKKISDILSKAAEKKGLTPEEAAALCNIKDPELIEVLFETAKKIKNEIYGKRIVFFAPLYVSNYCMNDCLYCAFRASNKDAVRHSLSSEELTEEIKLLQKQGHKRLILVFGEAPGKSAPEHIAEVVKKVYSIKTYNENKVEIGSIRRVNINAAPMDIEGYKTVKQAGIGTYQIFQETYHKQTYAKMHPPKTMKSDYMRRLTSLHRAQEAGIDDVGLGALFGLYDWRFEVISLIYHSISLDKYFGVGPHTISFPRIEPAFNTPFTTGFEYKVSDFDFKKAIAILRLAVPYTGLILTCRESAEFRNEVIKLGVSQIDAGSKIGIGGYSEAAKRNKIENKEQFTLADVRTLEEVINELLKDEFIPSFCTACYRLGRTGEHFMSHAKPGFIKRFCQPNALLTFFEYLTDYASKETIKKGETLINKLTGNLDDKIKTEVLNKIEQIKNGKRDLYF
ncbi:MAG TPA: [FeFe] hydrogenase H-cluster radical SAM maturase HydG [bacterium]|nr:[FeFe] hydrogenase H-cluster radical SAM maturase HydG [bacterium]HPN31968.1 [FeFe] hydrogenase H-cluster radical SAM maturase HydG [bacterium]